MLWFLQSPDYQITVFVSVFVCLSFLYSLDAPVRFIPGATLDKATVKVIGFRSRIRGL